MSIIGGIGLGLALIFGWQWWQRQDEQRALTAATQYSELSSAALAGDDTRTAAIAASVSQEFPGSPYSTLAALRLAHIQVGKGDAKAALATLQGVKGKTGDAALDDLVALRSARLQIALGQSAEAIKTLEGAASGSFNAIAAELDGDAQLALGRRDQARDAYQRALTALDVAAPGRGLLELKFADVGGRVDDASSGPAANPEA